MSRTFIATVLAASIAVTGFTSAPARAGNDDLGKFIAGAATLVILGKIIESERKGNVTVTTRTHQPQRAKPRGHITPRAQINRTRPLPARARKSVPASCLVTLPTRRGGQITGFGKRCLTRTMPHAARLPQSCAITTRSARGGHLRTMYKARCLKRHGYQTAWRR